MGTRRMGHVSDRKRQHYTGQPLIGANRYVWCWCLPKIETVQPADCLDKSGGVGQIVIHRVDDCAAIDV